MDVEVDDYGFTRRRSDYWPTGDIATLPKHLRPDKGETLDLILRQKVYLLQSRRGYRVNTDSHVLPYFASKVYSKRPRTPLRVLDLGAGVGLASIIFAKAHKPACLHLLELQGQLVNRAKRNLQLNEVKGRATRHDLKGGALPKGFRNSFDVVLMNPPFYRCGERRPPRLRENFLARMETSATFSDFLSAASAAIDRRNPDAFVAIIHDRKELPRLEPAFEPKKLSVMESCEMVHAPGESATRILLALQRDACGDAAHQLRRVTNSFHESLPSKASSGIPSFPPFALHSTMATRDQYSEEMEEFFHSLPYPSIRIGRLKEQPDI